MRVLLLFFLLTQGLLGDRPNVIVILVDDQGYYDLSCYGATEVKTENIDRMAAGGIRFTDYYSAAPICSPARAGLLTGSYPRRVGLETWVQRADSKIGLHRDERTMAELFHSYGYKTACIGKWHLGDYESFRPLQQGFDHYFGLMHNLDPVEVVYYEKEGGVPIIRNNEVVKRPADPAELTKLYTDEAIDFIKKNKEEPFFIYLPHTMLHNPLGASEQFKGKSKWGEYGDAILEMDHNVGRIMDCLKAEEIDQNTVVVYASDNGRGPGRNKQQPIQGRKLSTYEGGIRVPCIVWGPGLGIAAQTSSEITHAMDLLPTLATLANIKVPRDNALDGRDMAPIWQGKCKQVSDLKKHKTLNSDLTELRSWDQPLEWQPLFNKEEYQNAFFYHGSHGALAAVRSGKYKLYLNPTLKLYDLEKDPGETKFARSKGILKKLRGMAIMFQNEMREDARPAGKSDTKTIDLKKKTLPLKQYLKKAIQYKDIPYAKNGDKELLLDIYLPNIATKEKRSAMLCIHGGGWRVGSKINIGRMAAEYAANGYVAISINYRLVAEAKFPANIQDCKAAVRWLRANADKYNIDPDRIAATGTSAGGHLAALLASSAGVEALEGNGGNEQFSSAVQAAIPIAAQTNFLSPRIISISEETEGKMLYPKLLGGPFSTHSEMYVKASPITYLDKSDPPMLFISGEKDNTDTRAEKFRAKMTSLGIPSNYRMIYKAPHPFPQYQSWFDESFRTSLNFLKIHMP
ncbi:MAG: sulfatase-like hydrolase/transferase [Lentisphaeraceae bacterium]|nr:sulfatase-like hydrolase/transferase [Lentisphaeraceae bacterium]